MYIQIKVQILISQNMVSNSQYPFYTHDSLYLNIRKNAWVSGPQKTLKGWYSKWSVQRYAENGKNVVIQQQYYKNQN